MFNCSLAKICTWISPLKCVPRPIYTKKEALTIKLRDKLYYFKFAIFGYNNGRITPTIVVQDVQPSMSIVNYSSQYFL